MDEPTTNAAEVAERQAALLSAALPYMQKYENKTVVVKYGGHAMGDPELGHAFARDIALLNQSDCRSWRWAANCKASFENGD